VVFISDQESNTVEDYMPPGWEAANLPGKTRLLQNGILFDRAYTVATMCSPARASLLSGARDSRVGDKKERKKDKLDVLIKI
jgi:arylsulfatase A-like enzyme